MDHSLEVEASAAGQPLATDRTSDRSVVVAAKGGGILFAGQINATGLQAETPLSANPGEMPSS